MYISYLQLYYTVVVLECYDIQVLLSVYNMRASEPASHASQHVSQHASHASHASQHKNNFVFNVNY